MGGGILFLLFLLSFFVLYYLSYLLFPSVALKTGFYFSFPVFGSLLGICCFIRPFVRFFLSFSLRNDKLLREVTRFIPFRDDIFVSIYQFAFHQESVAGDPELKEAALIQKYDYLKEHSLPIAFPKRMLLHRMFAFLVVLVVSGSTLPFWGSLYRDMKNYTSVVSPIGEVKFRLLNENLDVEYGKSFPLRLQVESEHFEADQVFICFGGGEFLMQKDDSVFTYRFEAVNNDISFFFKTLDKQSAEYKIRMLPTPAITRYKVTAYFPPYTGQKPQVLENTVDFRVICGTSLKFEFSLSDVDSLYREEKGKYKFIPLKTPVSAEFTKRVEDSGELALCGSNAHFHQKELLNFNITCVPDLYPGIQVTQMQDSLRSSVYYFYGVITDDYGFTDLRFHYSLNGKTNTVIPVRIDKQLNRQEFYFTFDFSEFAGMDRTEVSYFFEVFDNDNLSGPKSARSDAGLYRIPDLNQILDYNAEVSSSVNSALKEAEKIAGEIVSGVKELQRKLLDNSLDDWEKQQLSKDIVEKKEKLDQLLNKVKEDNLKKSGLNQNFTQQDSVLIEKQKQIQDLLDKIMDDEMKKLMEEFSKLSEEFSKDRFKNLDEKMKLTFDQVSEELDRNIELLKRFQIEEQHDLMQKQLEKLKDSQDRFEKLSQEKSVSSDSLSSLAKDLKENMDHFRENYERLLEENKALAEPYTLENLNSELERLSEKMERQNDLSKAGKKDENLSRKIQKELEELSEKMEQQQQQNFMNKTLPQNDIELIIQNILIISLSQEELLKEFPQMPPQSSGYNELGRLQELKRQEYRLVKDSLSVLAKSNLMLASLLSHKFYDIEIKFGLLPGYIQDNKRSELLKTQQTIINYLNDIALSLTEALQKNQQNQGKKGQDGEQKKGGKSGDGNGSSSGNGEEGYGQLKKFQNSVKKQLEDLVSRMKKGENGKPLQRGISNMIRENELFRKSLSDFISGSGSLSPAEKQLLNEINRLLEENIRDLANYSVSNRLIQRNEQIYNKLIMSEKASREREEFEEKRKSESAQEALYQKPDLLFNFKKKAGILKTDFRKSDLKLNGYFKNMYNNYYIKLGNE